MKLDEFLNSQSNSIMVRNITPLKFGVNVVFSVYNVLNFFFFSRWGVFMNLKGFKVYRLFTSHGMILVTFL